jgi:NADH-quinone oxidoreductase subunit L
MFRLIFLTFHGAPADQHRFDHAHESPPVMVMPLILLAGFALLGGGTMHPLAETGGLWFNRVVAHPASAAEAALGIHHDAEHWEHALHASHYPALGISLLAIIMGFVLARRMYLTKATDTAAVAAKFGPLYTLVCNKYYFDDMYGNKGVVGALKRVNGILAWFDKNVVDGLVNLVGLTGRLVAFNAGLFDKYIIDGSVNFWRFFVRLLSAVFRLIQTGNARDYLTWTLLGVLILAIYLA